MRTLIASRHALGIGIAAVLLAGCGAPEGMPRTSVVNAVPRTLQPSSYKVLFRFGNAAERWQKSGLIEVGGTLYGTTTGGKGAVYSLSPSGKVKVLYRFGGGTGDGELPVGDLVNVNGTMYGATIFGGKCELGAVYSISTTGTEKLLHSFCGSAPFQPESGLINVNGVLYGTTIEISNGSGGTVYRMSASGGAFKLLHEFTNGRRSVSGPSGPLLDIRNTLYGTTSGGGANGDGTVFEINANGKERVLYSFAGGSDGGGPRGGLINVGGLMYGTGYGIVYSMTTTGKEKVLYSFRGGSDGEDPEGGLAYLNGALYGATDYGGGSGCRGNGCGTAYSVTTSGTEQVLHAFGGGTDGAHPSARLTSVDGTLYGTTDQGGFSSSCDRKGCGTVFTLVP